MKVKQAICLGIIIFFSGCASGIWQSSSRKLHVDQILVQPDGAYLFQYTKRRYLKIDPNQISDSLLSAEFLESKWKVIPSVSGNGRGLLKSVFKGPGDNFYAVESGSDRILQLDWDMRLISSIPLPSDMRDYDLSRSQFFQLPSRVFVLVNTESGVVEVYREAFGVLKRLRREKLPFTRGLCFGGGGCDRIVCGSAGMQYHIKDSGKLVQPLEQNWQPSEFCVLSKMAVEGEIPILYPNKSSRSNSICFNPAQKTITYCAKPH